MAIKITFSNALHHIRAHWRKFTIICIAVAIAGAAALALYIRFYAFKPVFKGGSMALSGSSDEDSQLRYQVAILQVEFDQRKDLLREAIKTGNAENANAILNAIDMRIVRAANAADAAAEADNKAADTTPIQVLEAKQDDLKEEVKALKTDNAALRQSMINAIVAIFAVPLIGGVITLAVDHLRRNGHKRKSTK
ncbi:MAG TPA: hypothetical protein VMY99_05490 [Nevskiaceae bacterium]|nr:hypothetical protein [Nevskiaceae bacterium]